MGTGRGLTLHGKVSWRGAEQGRGGFNDLQVETRPNPCCRDPARCTAGLCMEEPGKGVGVSWTEHCNGSGAERFVAPRPITRGQALRREREWPE